jgi:branched-chain amino acid transport system ATP-binding protein
MSAALELIDVRGGYGRIEVLRGVDLIVPHGKVTALLGPNGAGKTTVLRTVGGLLTPTSGCVHLDGVHVNGAAPSALARAGLCHIPEGRAIFPNLTVTENIRMTMCGKDRSLSQVLDAAFTRFPRLAERRTQVAGTMSGGEQQMLAMARSLTGDPGLLLLDEISMGLAPMIVRELYELVGQLAAGGITILVVEQFARIALGVADFAAVMSGGVITTVGQPGDVADAVEDAYFGGAA